MTIDVDDVLFGAVDERVVVRFVETAWSPIPNGYHYFDGRGDQTVDDVQWTVLGDLEPGAGRLVPGVRLGLLLASMPGESWFTKVSPFLTVDGEGRLGVLPSVASACPNLLPAEIVGATASEARDALASCEVSQTSIFEGITEGDRGQVDMGTCDLPKVGLP